MSKEETRGDNRRYYYVFQGNLRTKAKPTDPQEVVIERVNKNGVLVKEKEVTALFGTIEDVDFFDGEHGRNVRVFLDKNEDGETPVLSFGAENRDGEEVMKRLPSIDFSKEVRISPYKFTPENSDKEKSGVSIKQRDEEGNFTVKVQDFFYNGTNGAPKFDWENGSEADRKIHFIKLNEFLQKYTNDNIITKFQGVKQEEDPADYPQEDIKPEDIPF